MPELPEVEVARRNLTRWVVGASLARVALRDSARFDGQLHALIDSVCLEWKRRGKMLLARFDNGLGLMSHLGMTGKWVRDDLEERAHCRIWLATSKGVGVSLVDTRRFGRTWVRGYDELIAHPRWRRLGPDALDTPLDGPSLAERVGARRTALKNRLLDQAVVAGLGNIAVVEACWRARVHPHTPCVDVDTESWERLAVSIVTHLDHVLEVEDGDEIIYLSERGATNPFLVYGRSGQPCPRCSVTLCGGALSGRPSVWCPACQ